MRELGPSGPAAQFWSSSPPATTRRSRMGEKKDQRIKRRTDGTAPLRAWLSGTVPCPFRAAPPAAPALGIPRLHCSCRDLDTTDASRGFGPARVLSCPPNPILQLAAPAAGGPRGAKHRQGQHLCPLLDASQSWPCARPSWPAHRVCRGGLPPPY